MYGSIAKREKAIDVQATLRLEDSAGGRFWSFKMGSEGLVVPGIFEAVAAVGDKDKFDAEFLCGSVEGTGLVAEFGGEEKDPLACFDRVVASRTGHSAIIRKT
jgi:hypothetical protein